MEGGKIEEMYKECLRNHAASLGSYATDGCGEFTAEDGGGLNCAACGCHRNFHRKVSSTQVHTSAAEMVDCRAEMSGKKRFRTKFTEEQKEKMLSLAEKLGWRLQRKDEEDEIERFCRGIGISRKVFKVWMHNHKNSPSLSANASSLTDDH
ncbi:zinc-finger homeodomain protein 2-like [Salvia miltiorrhiza]|uniref:zinc-finger homeodomain protein 2-like n=1 Tax=Salvia miltiorrhiza TaxID=226208 RepID=UPI0025AB984A|nr:zinc-finger homeodomain protein 2-like [Salvia miltiorrhiza]